MSGETLLIDDLKQLISQNCNNKQFVCKDCSRLFSKIDNLNIHICGKSIGKKILSQINLIRYVKYARQDFYTQNH